MNSVVMTARGSFGLSSCLFNRVRDLYSKEVGRVRVNYHLGESPIPINNERLLIRL